jgi:hypothetical protein
MLILGRIYAVWATNGWKALRILCFNGRRRLHLRGTTPSISLLLYELCLGIEDRPEGIAMSLA